MTIQLFIIIKGLDNPLKQVLYKENLKSGMKQEVLPL